MLENVLSKNKTSNLPRQTSLAENESSNKLYPYQRLLYPAQFFIVTVYLPVTFCFDQ